MNGPQGSVAGVPRTIQPRLKIAIFFSGPLAFIGTFFFVFGMIFPIVFASQSDMTSVLHFRESDPAVPGKVVSVLPTGASQNSERIFDYHYRYSADGQAYEGHSFAGEGQADEGGTVLIRYSPRRPSLSRVDGMRSAPFPPWVVLLTAVFPAIGIVMLYFGSKRFARNLHLLRNGVLTTGHVGRKEATSVRINDQQVYRVFFTFKTPDGQVHESFTETHEIDNLRDERDEPIVYDPATPAMAVLVDSLPPKVRQYLTDY